jgi:hypothetical protein
MKVVSEQTFPGGGFGHGPSAVPTRTACFQPHNCHDLALFTESAELSPLIACLEGFVRSGGPGQGKILLWGRGGVGKSILARKAVDEVRAKHAPLTVLTDGTDDSHGPGAFLRRLAKGLSKEVLSHAAGAPLCRSAELLLRLTAVPHVTVKQVDEWCKALRLAENAEYCFPDTVKFELGPRRLPGTMRPVEETYVRAVDGCLLRALIQSLIIDCHREELPVMMLLDNLDQTRYWDSRDEACQVLDLARSLLGLERCVVVATLRSELLTAGLHTLCSVSVEVTGRSPTELMTIVTERINRGIHDAREKIPQAGMMAIARRLATWTDNVRALLQWLSFLDFEGIHVTAGEDDKLRGMLERFTARIYPGVRPEEVRMLGQVYDRDTREVRTEPELSAAGASKELIARARRFGVLVPERLPNPDRYLLAPTLHFLLTRRRSLVGNG